MNEQDLFQPSAPGARFAAHCCVAVLVFTPSGFHRKFATKPVCSETNKQSGDQVLTMALLGTRGPQLFRMMRGGLGSRGRRCARSTQRLINQLRLALESECFKNPANHHQEELAECLEKSGRIRQIELYKVNCQTLGYTRDVRKAALEEKVCST